MLYDLFQCFDKIYPLSDACKMSLLSVFKEQELVKNQSLLKIGHVCRNIYFVQKGLLRGYCFHNDKPVSSRFMIEGDLCTSHQSFFNQTTSKEAIRAMEESLLYYMNYEDLQEVYRCFPEFHFITEVFLRKDLFAINNRLLVLQSFRPQERYEWLEQIASELVKRVPALYLASYIGLSPECISRIKRKRYG